MDTQGEPEGDDRTGQTGLDVAAPPPPQATAGGPAAQDGAEPRRSVARTDTCRSLSDEDGRATRGRGRGRHRAPRRWPSRRFLLVLGVAMTVAGALGGAATLTLSVPWLWPRIGRAALHHPDTVLATVMLAASLAAVWRMSGPGTPDR